MFELRRALLVVVAIILASCATASPLPPQKAIADVKSVAGTWTGKVKLVSTGAIRSAGGAPGTHFATLTIHEDGSWENIIPSLAPGRFSGTLGVQEGVLRFRSYTTGAVGTYALHEGGGQRLLILSTEPRTATGVFTPEK